MCVCVLGNNACVQHVCIIFNMNNSEFIEFVQQNASWDFLFFCWRYSAILRGLKRAVVL